jgi:hypothetical protein
MVMISGGALAPLPLAALQPWSGGYAFGLALLLGLLLGYAVIAALVPNAARSGVPDRQNADM